MELAGFGDLPPRQMSAGQQRRVSLARLALGLAHPSADLWLLDEPFTALDASGQRMVVELMSAHQARGGAVLFSTHQLVEGLQQVRECWLGDPELAA